MKKSLRRPLLTWLTALTAGLLVVVGTSIPSQAATATEVDGFVVDTTGMPVGGVEVTVFESGTECTARADCDVASTYTSGEDGSWRLPKGFMIPSGTYDITLNYSDLSLNDPEGRRDRYVDDYALGKPAWGRSTYQNVSGIGPSSRQTFVLVPDKAYSLYGNVRDAGNSNSWGVYAYLAGQATKPRAAGYSDPEGMAAWRQFGKYSFRGLPQGKRYVLYIADANDEGRGQWVGGTSYASAKQFVAGSGRHDLVYSPAPKVLKSSSAPRISGVLRVGSKLTASKGSWTDGPTSYAYQWLRDGRVIKGATKSSYVLAAVDEGHRIRAKVTGKRSGYTSASAQTSATGKIGAGRFTVKKKPAISGTQLAGRKLTVSKGTWSSAPTSVSYRWYRNGKAIKAATKSTYKLTTADRGKKISATVWAKKAGYATKSAKSGSKYIYKSGLKIGAVSVKGTRKVGKTVKAAVAKPSGVTVKYQWYRNGSAIKGATKASYKLREDDWLEKVSVRVTYSRAGLPTVGKRSAKVYIPDNPYAYDEDDYYSDEDDYSGGSSGGSSSGGDPKCWAPGGKTQIPCP